MRLHLVLSALLASICVIGIAYADFPIDSSPIYFPDSIKAGDEAKFSIKVTNKGPSYFVSDIRTVVDVMPKSAAEFVHVTASTNLTLWKGYSELVYGTIRIDKEIPHQRIFVSIYFVGKDMHGSQVPLASPDNNFDVKIQSPDVCCHDETPARKEQSYIHTIQHGNYKYFIPYKISGGKLYDVQLDCTSGYLMVYLQEAVGGTLTLSVPRKMLDARDGADIEFIAILDGLETESAEIHVDTDVRTMEIRFEKDSSMIEIIAALWPGEAHCGDGDAKESPYYRLMSPLEQQKSGTLAQYVVCNPTLELLIKAGSGQPVCVKPETKERLLNDKLAENVRIIR